MLLKLKLGLSSLYFVQNDKRSARNLVVIARMPEDRSNTVNNLQTLSTTFKAIYTCMCAPVGPTDSKDKYYLSLPRLAFKPAERPR
eukprot:15839431-Heterocapsa_arctica.AAC.1